MALVSRSSTQSTTCLPLALTAAPVAAAKCQDSSWALNKKETVAAVLFLSRSTTLLALRQLRTLAAKLISQASSLLHLHLSKRITTIIMQELHSHRDRRAPSTPLCSQLMMCLDIRTTRPRERTLLTRAVRVEVVRTVNCINSSTKSNRLGSTTLNHLLRRASRARHQTMPVDRSQAQKTTIRTELSLQLLQSSVSRHPLLIQLPQPTPLSKTLTNQLTMTAQLILVSMVSPITACFSQV